MMKILIAVSEDKESIAAVNAGAELAEKLGAEITLLHGITQETHTENEQLIQESVQEAEERAEVVLTQMENELSGEDISYTSKIAYGNSPLDAVLTYIKAEEPEVVFIGHRNLPEKEEYYLGSFAKDLIKNSPVPVTVVTPQMYEN